MVKMIGSTMETQDRFILEESEAAFKYVTAPVVLHGKLVLTLLASKPMILMGPQERSVSICRACD
jgi:hypothetical protein